MTRSAHFRRTIFIASAMAMLAGGAVLVSASKNSAADTLPENFAGARSLTVYGAVGDGRADDTAALQRALDDGAKGCLDGSGRTYLVSGTLRASSDLCLARAHLVQTPPASPTQAFIGGECPRTVDPEAAVDCRDRALSRGDAGAFQRYAQVRTLFVRPAEGTGPSRVRLLDVTIDRGGDPSSGSRTDAAALWLENVSGAVLENVTITGAGKGYGLMIAHSRDVTVRGLKVHDLVWAPYEGDASLSLARVRGEGWNRPMVRELRPSRRVGGLFDLRGTRVQEQLVCVMIAGSRQVTLHDTTIAGCRARFSEGDVPWQADGLNISQDSRDVSILGDTRISDTWEGIDVAGGGEAGASAIRIDGATITGSFAFGIKLGHRLSDVQVLDTRISGAGLAGATIYGPVEGISLNGLTIDMADQKPGRGKAPIAEWPATKVGILIERSGSDVPRGIRLSDIAVTGGASCSAGVSDRPGAGPEVTGLRVSGCKTRFATGD
jgi:hypothetical protein